MNTETLRFSTAHGMGGCHIGKGRMQCAGRSHFSCTGAEIKRFSVVDVWELWTATVTRQAKERQTENWAVLVFFSLGFLLSLSSSDLHKLLQAWKVGKCMTTCLSDGNMSQRLSSIHYWILSIIHVIDTF